MGRTATPDLSLRGVSIVWLAYLAPVTLGMRQSEERSGLSDAAPKSCNRA